MSTVDTKRPGGTPFYGRAAGPLGMWAVSVAGVKPYADAAAHSALTDDQMWCIITRRHQFPPPAREAKVRLPYDGGVLDLFEGTSTCRQCATVRTSYRDQADDRYVYGVYTYSDGYLPPEGTQWDRDYLKQVWRKRHPVKGAARTLKR